MMRNFLLLSLLVVACYANRAILRTSGGQMEDVYTLWKFGPRDKEGKWGIETKLFYVKFENVPQPQAFIDEFSKKGHEIAKGFDHHQTDETWNSIGFERGVLKSDTETNVEVWGTINDNESIQINVHKIKLPSYDNEQDTAPFLSFIGSKAIPFLKEHLKKYSKECEKALQA
eukprot:Platyproteum_vivax@DN7077_c0_g1_i5.p1